MPKRYNQWVSDPAAPMPDFDTSVAHQVSRFFDGLSLVPPGVVYVHTRRPDPGTEVPGGVTSAHGGVGRKPGRTPASQA